MSPPAFIPQPKSSNALWRVEGCVGLGSWLHSEVFARPKTLTHPSTNRARRRVTLSIRSMPLPRQPADTS